MREHSVVTIRVMLNTDQEEKAQELAEFIQNAVMHLTDIGGRRYALDTEYAGHSFHGGRSFLYRDPSTTTKGDA